MSDQHHAMMFVFYSMPHTQINTMSDQLLAIQENLTRVLVQVESAKSSYSRWSGLMASISNQIQELISEESSLVHSPSLSDCQEHFDENVESALEDELLNCVDKVFVENSQRDVTNSLAPIVAIELSLVSSTVSRGSNLSSGTTQNLHPPKVAIAISSSNVELAYKLFDTPSDMELFAHSYDPNTPIASLPLDIGSRNCKWVDTGQVGGSLYLDVKLFHRFCDILGMSPYLLAKCARKLFVELSDTKIFEVSHGVLHLCNELCGFNGNVAEMSYATGPVVSFGPTFRNASVGFGGSCFPTDNLHLICICKYNSMPQYMFLHLPFDPGSERLMLVDFATLLSYDILVEETLFIDFFVVDFAQLLRAAPFYIIPSTIGNQSNSIANFNNYSQSLFTIAKFYVYPYTDSMDYNHLQSSISINTSLNAICDLVLDVQEHKTHITHQLDNVRSSLPDCSKELAAIQELSYVEDKSESNLPFTKSATSSDDLVEADLELVEELHMHINETKSILNFLPKKSCMLPFGGRECVVSSAIKLSTVDKHSEDFLVICVETLEKCAGGAYDGHIVCYKEQKLWASESGHDIDIREDLIVTWLPRPLPKPPFFALLLDSLSHVVPSARQWLEYGSLQLYFATFSHHALFREALHIIKSITYLEKLFVTHIWTSYLLEFTIRDENRLMIILSNVVGNAVNLSQEGSVSRFPVAANSESLRNHRAPEYFPMQSGNLSSFCVHDSVDEAQHSVALAKEVIEYIITEGIISGIGKNCYLINSQLNYIYEFDSVKEANASEGAMSKGRKWVLDQPGILTIIAWGAMWIYVIGAFEWSEKIPYEDVNNCYICFGFVNMIFIIPFCWGAPPTPKAFKLHRLFLGTGRVIFSVYFGPMWRIGNDNHNLPTQFLMQMAASHNTLILERPLYAALAGLAFKERLCYGNMESGILTMVIPSLLLGPLHGGVLDGEKFIIFIIKMAQLVVFALRKFTFVDYDKFCHLVDYDIFCHSVAALNGFGFTPILHASGKEYLALDSLSFDYREHLGMETIGGTITIVLDSNLEDKVLIEDGRNVMNINKIEDTFRMMSNYVWDPGIMSLNRRVT